VTVAGQLPLLPPFLTETEDDIEPHKNATDLVEVDRDSTAGSVPPVVEDDGAGKIKSIEATRLEEGFNFAAEKMKAQFNELPLLTDLNVCQVHYLKELFMSAFHVNPLKIEEATRNGDDIGLTEEFDLTFFSRTSSINSTLHSNQGETTDNKTTMSTQKPDSFAGTSLLVFVSSNTNSKCLQTSSHSVPSNKNNADLQTSTTLYAENSHSPPCNTSSQRHQSITDLHNSTPCISLKFLQSGLK
jgi:hypothetical protein